jgi:hypothetical protein
MHHISEAAKVVVKAVIDAATEKGAHHAHPQPGQIVRHATATEDGFEDELVGVQVGLMPGLSLYVGELAIETQRFAGIPPELIGMPAYWIVLQSDDDLTFLGACYRREELEAMATAIARAITDARS